MRLEVAPIRHITITARDLLVCGLLPYRPYLRRYGAAQPVEGNREAAPSRGVGKELTCTKVRAENRTTVRRAGFLSVQPYGSGSCLQKGSAWTWRRPRDAARYSRRVGAE